MFVNTNKKIGLLVFSVMSVALSSCAHHVVRGAVAMKLEPNQVEVCMGSEELNLGDRVSFFKNDCPKPNRAFMEGGAACHKEKVGEGVIIQILNEDYSIVDVKSGKTPDTGSIVEKY